MPSWFVQRGYQEVLCDTETDKNMTGSGTTGVYRHHEFDDILYLVTDVDEGYEMTELDRDSLKDALNSVGKAKMYFDIFPEEDEG